MSSREVEVADSDPTMEEEEGGSKIADDPLLHLYTDKKDLLNV